MLTLAGWGLLDRRLPKKTRALLALAPLIYGALFFGMSLWGSYSHQVFGGQARVGGEGDISSFSIRHLVEHAFDHRHSSVVRCRLRRVQFRLDTDAVSASADGVLRPHARPRSELPGRAGHSAGRGRSQPHVVCAVACAAKRDRRWPGARFRRQPKGFRATGRLGDRLACRRSQHARVPVVVRLFPAPRGVRFRPVPRAARSGHCACTRMCRGQRHAPARHRRDVARPRRLAGALRLSARRHHLLASGQCRRAGKADCRRPEQHPLRPPRRLRCGHRRRTSGPGDRHLPAFHALPARCAADGGVGDGARRNRRDRQGALPGPAAEGIPQRAGG